MVEFEVVSVIYAKWNPCLLEYVYVIMHLVCVHN